MYKKKANCSKEYSEYYDGTGDERRSSQKLGWSLLARGKEYQCQYLSGNISVNHNTSVIAKMVSV